MSRVCPGAIIVQKGPKDLIAAACSNMVVHCEEEGSFRRCGGQGDVLSGLMGTFSAWMQLNRNSTPSSEWYLAGCFLMLSKTKQNHYSRFIPVYSACAMTRRCSLQAFKRKQRSMLTTDIIEEISKEFNTVFPLR